MHAPELFHLPTQANPEPVKKPISGNSGKVRYIFLALLCLLLVGRGLAPGFILEKLNAYLGTFSPLYRLHITELNLHFYRMAYSFHGVTGQLVAHERDKDGGKFIDIKDVEVSLAWRALLRGKFVADVKVAAAKAKLTTGALNALSGKGVQVKEDAQSVKEATVPFNLESLRIEESIFVFSDMAGLPPEQDFRVTHAEIVVNNLTPSSRDGLAIFTALGDVQGIAKIKAVGQLRPNPFPAEWSINLELHDFGLAKLNPIARRMVPLTFKSGSLSLYAAARSVDGKMFGYVKPFLTDVVFIGDRDDFKNVGQFFIEIAGTIGNWFLKNGKNHSLATKIVFRSGRGGRIEVDTNRAIQVAVDNGFGEALPRQIDETLELN